MDKTSNLSIELEHYELTWGDLRAFVRMGEGIPDGAPVETAYDDIGEQVGFRITGATLPGEQP